MRVELATAVLLAPLEVQELGEELDLEDEAQVEVPQWELWVVPAWMVEEGLVVELAQRVPLVVQELMAVQVPTVLPSLLTEVSWQDV